MRDTRRAMRQQEIETHRIVLVTTTGRTIAALDTCRSEEALAPITKAPILVLVTQSRLLTDHVLHRHVGVAAAAAMKQHEMLGAWPLNTRVGAVVADERNRPVDLVEDIGTFDAPLGRSIGAREQAAAACSEGLRRARFDDRTRRSSEELP